MLYLIVPPSLLHFILSSSFIPLCHLCISLLLAPSPFPASPTLPCLSFALIALLLPSSSTSTNQPFMPPYPPLPSSHLSPSRSLQPEATPLTSFAFSTG